MFEQSIAAISADLNESRFENLEGKFNDLTTQNPVEDRIKGFYWGRFLFRQGRLKEAARSLQKTIKEHGPHVSVYSELISIYYFLGDVLAFRETVLKLESEVQEVGFLLSATSLIRTQIILGKSFEELGEVAKALETYKSCLSRCKINDELSEIQYRVLAQVLRLECEFGSAKQSKEYYLWLSYLAENVFSTDFDVEIEHALLAAELHLFSPQIAEERLDSLLAISSISSLDRDLLVSELFFSIGKHFCELSPSQRLRLQEWTPESQEDQLLKYLLTHNLRINNSDIFKLKKAKLSVSQRIRLYHLTLQTSIDKELAGSLRIELNLILQSLNDSSRKMWKRRCHVESQRAEISLQGNFLSYQNQDINLKNRLPALVICQELAKSNSLNIESLVQIIWGTPEFDESYFHRLRMQVRRLNESIYKLCSVKGAISIDKTNLRLCGQVKFMEAGK